MTVISADAGIIGLPTGVKERGKRVDFKPNDFALLIETKGYRIAWSRAAQCPCTPINEQTDQANPNCTLCNGTGWLLFKPIGAIVDPDIIGTLDDTQTLLVGNTGAVVRGIMSQFAGKFEAWDQITARMQGTMYVTVRPENKLGYYDRITDLDSVIVYSQILESTSPQLSAKYLIRDVNLLRSETKEYAVTTDFTIVDGKVEWVQGKEPSDGTRLVLNYYCHPTWRIIEHPHTLRTTPVKFKTASPITPQGNPEPLAVQGLLQYEFLL